MSIVSKKYIIQLENEKFATFEQDGEYTISLYGNKEFADADFFEEDDAKKIFDDLVEHRGWGYYGECVKPSKIMTVNIVLLDE